MRLTQFLGALVLAAASSGFMSAANAQTTPFSPVPVVEYTGPRTVELDASFSTPPRRLETIPEAFNRAFFRESGDFYRNRKIDRQINYIIGAGVPWGAGFPDLELERDAERVFKLYQEALEIQASTGPVIRTPDLANPFDTSVRLLSGPPRFGNRLEGGEFIFDSVPPR